MIFEWMKNNEIIWWMSGFSIVTFIGTLIAIPWLIIRLPSDYFSEKKRVKKIWATYHPVIRIGLLTIKNLFGLFLIFIGILMLVLPGPGMLTILFGIIFIDMPGKYRFEKWIIEQSKILASINWIRNRARQKPIVL
jgi:hypothetical protein